MYLEATELMFHPTLCQLIMITLSQQHEVSAWFDKGMMLDLASHR